MFSNKAWQRHGCYRLGSDQYFNMPLERALLGCTDDWNSLDHFDPTTDSRRMFGHLLYLRSAYSSLQDGFDLVQLGNWTYFIQLPGSNGTRTEMGLWSISRSGIPGVQTLAGNNDQIWMLYTNENATKNYQFDCKSPQWISSPYVSGTTVRNLVAPFENYTLVDSLSSSNNDDKAPFQGCLAEVMMDPYSFKILVPINEWVPPRPALTKFSPGHDARISSGANATTVTISFEFNTVMSCAGVTTALSLNMSSSGHGGNPTFDANSVTCGPVQNPDPPKISGDVQSVWSWSVTLQNVPDGILALTLDDAPASDGRTTGVCYQCLSFSLFNDSRSQSKDTLLIRKGASNNVIVFPASDYDNSAFGFSNGQYTFSHKAYGADSFRYSWNFGQNWTQWKSWENTTFIDSNLFSRPDNFWPGQHIIVQCKFVIAFIRTDTERCSRLERRREICQCCSSCRSRLQFTTSRAAIARPRAVQFLGL
jgi:alpha-1,3-glucan synthase